MGGQYVCVHLQGQASTPQKPDWTHAFPLIFTGTPLLEIVSAPDMRSGRDAYQARLIDIN